MPVLLASMMDLHPWLLFLYYLLLPCRLDPVALDDFEIEDYVDEAIDLFPELFSPRGSSSSGSNEITKHISSSTGKWKRMNIVQKQEKKPVLFSDSTAL